MIESDSDGEVFTNTNGGFHFSNDTTTVSARGPNTNASNLTGIMSFRSNVLSSTMQMPRTFERHRYVESNYEQRSMYERRRETSPMSVMSACDERQRNFNNSYYPQAMGSQTSANNGRSRSPMSVRSIDSSASVSAANIAMAFKSMSFNKHEVRMIKEAYNKFMKHRVRKKIEKRRNLKQFLKGCRRISGGDSGDQGSDSSISSDDRSTKTSNYKGNMSSCRSTKTDITHIRREIKESNMYKDCTDNFKNNSFRSMISEQGNPNISQSCVSSHISMFAGSSMSSRNMPLPANLDNLQKKPSLPTMSQKERFQNGFLLPSQRFNRSVAATSIPEIAENNNHKNYFQNGEINERNSKKLTETDSDQDENIFSGPTKQKNENVQRKRSIESDDDIISLPNKKRTKTVSPCKNCIKTGETIPNETVYTENNDKSNGFVFAKPTCPVRKSTKEKLLAKCNVPLLDTVLQEQHNQNSNPEKDEVDDQTNVTQSTTDLSSRPSFIKRKLFTQKLDVSEKKNISTDSSNSPQNSIYGAIQKEKHKARKLQQVMTQSCLSRDIQDESNLLDLIHKIVPREQMNATNQTNKTDLQNSKNKSDDTEKWDVTSIISERNNEDNGSDTYTDEEIFNATFKEIAKENPTIDCNKIQKKVNIPTRSPKECTKANGRMQSKKMQAKETSPKKHSPLKRKTCKVLIEKLPEPVKCLTGGEINEQSNDAYKKVQRGVKLFWDTTDVESDAECQPAPRNNASFKENHRQENELFKEVPKFQGVGNKFNTKKLTNASTFLNNTDIIQKFDTTTLRIRSHRNPTRKNLDYTRADDDGKSTVVEPRSKKQQPVQTNGCIVLSKTDPKTKIVTLSQKSNDTVTELTKTDNKKKTKCKTQTFKTDISKNYKESPKKLTPKKQTNRTNKQVKKVESDLKINNDNKENVQTKDEIKKDINKQKKTNKKSNKKNLNDTMTEEQVKSTTIKTTPNKRKNNNQVPVENKQQSKRQSNNAKKNKLSSDDKTKEQTKTNKKLTETKSQNKKQSSKTKSTKKISLKDDYFANDTFDKENNTANNRTLRSCRLAKRNNETTLNETINRTLRSRQIDSSSSTINSNAKTKPKVNTTKAESRLSDVSFSLAKKETVGKKTVTSRFLQTDVESSDVSFSITAVNIPTPKKAISSKSNSKADKKQQNVSRTLNNNTLQSESKTELKPNRNRMPNKKYLNNLHI